MKIYHYLDEPLRVFGAPCLEQTGKLQRLPEALMQKLKNLELFGKRCPGARLCFRTNSSELRVKITLETLSVDIGMSIFSCQSAAVLIGERSNAHFAGLVFPPNYDTRTFECTFQKSDQMEDITIFLPRNEQIADVEIGIEDTAAIEAPTPYKNVMPVIYYGSSITEGGCCCNIFNAYNAILSNRLNIDYYNFGFSANAKGELEVADYISSFDMSIFVFDYDHNAPTKEHLLATHEPFFKRIREKKPMLPIIMMSRPAAVYSDDDKLRREIIRKTYENALAAGDSNVYFIDGETFYGEKDRELCSIDTVHPNDIGFLRMADTIEPVMKKILKL